MTGFKRALEDHGLSHDEALCGGGGGRQLAAGRRGLSGQEFIAALR